MNRDRLRDGIEQVVLDVLFLGQRQGYDMGEIRGKRGCSTDIAPFISRILSTPSGPMLTRECVECEGRGKEGSTVQDGKLVDVGCIHANPDRCQCPPCPTCKGTGKQTRPMTLGEMVEWVGIEMEHVGTGARLLLNTFTDSEGIPWEVQG